MKHWDGRDRPEGIELRLPRHELARLAQFFESPAPPRRRQPSNVGSMIGLVLALGMLAGLAWMLAPVDPVAPDLIP